MDRVLAMHAIATVHLTWSRSDGWNLTRKISTQSRFDRHTIVARLNRDCGSFEAIVAHDHVTIGGHQSVSNRGSNVLNFLGENPFKNLCIPIFFLTFD